MFWTQPYTRHRTTTNKTNNTTLYVLDITIHKTQDDNKQMVVSNTYSVVLFVLFVVVCVLCMVVSNTYSVVLFVLFVVVLCLVYGCVQDI
jgi:ABC-type multidrug transport system permease subunit